jgi:integrase
MSPAPSLALFNPPDKPTFLETYQHHWMHLRQPGTRNCDLEALRLFDRVNPYVPAESLTWEHTRKFRRELDDAVKSGRMSQNQANKLARHANRFLKLLGPNDGSFDPEDPTDLCPLGILPAPLRLKAPPKQRREVDGWVEIEESGAFLAAAKLAKWLNPVTGKALSVNRGKRRAPKIAAPHWWHSAWIFVYNSALRIDEAIEVLQADLFEDKYGRWLRVRKEVSKTGKERMVYLNDHAAAAVARLCSCDHPKIMAWDYSHSFLDRCRREIFERAGLTRLLGLGVGWHGLRKSCATELVKIAAGSQKNGMEIAAKHLGHEPKLVTNEYYAHRSIVIPYVDKLPQPIIPELPPDENDRQLKLFD